KRGRDAKCVADRRTAGNRGISTIPDCREIGNAVCKGQSRHCKCQKGQQNYSSHKPLLRISIPFIWGKTQNVFCENLRVPRGGQSSASRIRRIRLLLSIWVTKVGDH